MLKLPVHVRVNSPKIYTALEKKIAQANMPYLPLFASLDDGDGSGDDGDDGDDGS